MHQLFGELKRLPCSYCRFSNSFTSHCLDRKKLETEDLPPCNHMSPNMEIVTPAIEKYFEYLELLDGNYEKK